MEFAVGCHDGPPLKATCLRLVARFPAGRPGEGSVAEMGGNGAWGAAFGERMAFGRNGRPETAGPTAGTPHCAACPRMKSARRDGRGRLLVAPGQLRRAYLQQRGPSELLREIVEEEWVQLKSLDSPQAEFKVLKHIHQFVAINEFD